MPTLYYKKCLHFTTRNVRISRKNNFLRVLLEKDYITGENDVFGIYDRFFGMWIAENW